MENTPVTSINRTASKGSGRVAFVGGVLLFGVLFYVGLRPKLQNKKQLSHDAAAVSTDEPNVGYMKPHLVSDASLILPGSIQAISETSVQARTNGYVKLLTVDIGSRVKRGQVLAEIESPDVDQQAAQANADTAKSQATVGQSLADVARLRAGVAQSHADVAKGEANVKQAKSQLAGAKSKLAQARAGKSFALAKLAQSKQQVEVQRANLAQMQAQLDLASATEKRYANLLQQGFVAQQDYDQSAATLKTTAANVQSARANLNASSADVDAARQTVEANDALVDAADSDVDAALENVHAAEAALNATATTVDAANANVQAGQANVQANRAQVGSSQANARRFQVLRGFERVVAPYDGVITSRNVDVGSLVAPGTNEPGSNSSTPNTGLFGLARTDVLRIRINLPQSQFQTARDGGKVDVMIKELPNRIITGEIVQSAGAIDSASRTLLTEVHIPNQDNSLLPGMYAQVKITPKTPRPTVRVAANTLMFDASGTRVIKVGPDDKLHYATVVLGRDFGQEMEVVSGVNTADRLVTNPTDDLTEGLKVKPEEIKVKPEPK